MAASKDILFWTPSGQLLRNKRPIPVTNIAELVEYVLLPHNNEVTKPRALNTFLDGLAELVTLPFAYGKHGRFRRMIFSRRS